MSAANIDNVGSATGILAIEARNEHLAALLWAQDTVMDYEDK